MIVHPRLPLTISSLAALLAFGLSLAGILQPGRYQPMTPDQMISGAVSQDAISVVASLALLVLTRPLARGASGRVWLVWLGLTGYLAYAYGLYAFETIINTLFLGYIAVFGLAFWAIVAFFGQADLGKLAARGAPRRLTAGLFVGLAAMFLVLWLSILLPAMATRTPPAAATIFVLDLAIVLPALVIAASLLWRARRWGDVLALPLLVKAATLGLSVLIGTLLGPAWGNPLVLVDIPIYAILTLLPAALILPWWRSLAP